MNHDYTHCLDYNETCPKTCFRAELAEDIEKRKDEFVGIPLSYSHLKGTFLCDWYSEDSGNKCGLT